jgi:hypothetical protein
MKYTVKLLSEKKTPLKKGDECSINRIMMMNYPVNPVHPVKRIPE